MHVIPLIHFIISPCSCTVLCTDTMITFSVGTTSCFWFADETLVDVDWIGLVLEGTVILVRPGRKGVTVVWILIDLNKDEDVAMNVEGLIVDCSFSLISSSFWHLSMMLSSASLNQQESHDCMTFMGCFVLIKSTVTFTFHITIWGTFGWDMLVLPRTDPTRLAHFSTWAVREVYAHDARYTVNVCSLWYTWSALNRGTCTLRTFGARPTSFTLASSRINDFDKSFLIAIWALAFHTSTCTECWKCKKYLRNNKKKTLRRCLKNKQAEKNLYVFPLRKWSICLSHNPGDRNVNWKSRFQMSLLVGIHQNSEY